MRLVRQLVFLGVFIMAGSTGFAKALPQSNAITLQVVEQTLTIDGKKSKVYNIVQPDGTEGFYGKKGDYFNVILENKTPVPISIHWHGLILPNNQDGIPYVTQFPIPPGKSKHYYYKLVQAGTYWMHSHFKYYEQQLMLAPFIITDPKDPYANDKSVLMLLGDFTFKDPREILKELRHPKKMAMVKDEETSDINDVDYNYFITNRRTLKNPQIVRVTPGENVRLRIINSSSASNFWVNTGKLTGTVIATDGAASKPFKSKKFELAVAQRLDILVKIPKGEGAYPILAQGEGTNLQTGLILATPNAKIPKLSTASKTTAPALTLDQEKQFHAIHPFKEKPIDISLSYVLGGDMQKYVWTINDEVWPYIKPLKIKKNARVEMVFTNRTAMSHPMHFHGHVFQVTEINGEKLKNGPRRDTVLVPPHGTVKVIYDADNPGIWLMHCHILYHLLSGMMSTVNYQDYPEPSFYKKLLRGDYESQESPSIEKFIEKKDDEKKSSD